MMKVKPVIAICIISTILLYGKVYAEETRISETEIETSQELITGEITRDNAVMLLSEAEEPTIVETWDISATEADNVIATLYSNGLLEITGTGSMKGWNSDAVPWYSYRTNIITVRIAEGVKSVGRSAFYYCSSLTNIEISESVTIIENTAFYGCNSLTRIEIPEGVISLGNAPFGYCKSLTEIIVDENNQSYCSDNGVLLNKDKTKLIRYPAGKTETNYTIPTTIINIERYAFSYCNLVNIEIPDVVTIIEQGTFSDCDNLANIKIPNSVTAIESYAFDDCNSLTSINIPYSVTKIERCAFVYCESLTEITVDKSNQNYCSENGVLFNKNKTELICYPAGKTETNYAIPTTITKIGEFAFGYCNLKSIEIPDSVTSIESHAFSYCELTSVNIPDSVKSIGSYAFYYAMIYAVGTTGSINIPDSVTSIGDYAFSGCKTVVAVQTGINNGQEIKTSLPSLLQRTLDEEDIMYANGTAPTLNNCTISTDNQTIIFNADDVVNKNVTVTIRSGPLNRPSSSSSTIWHDFLQYNKLDQSRCNSKNLCGRWRNYYK